MAHDKENSVRLTRAAAKRRAADHSALSDPPPSAAKKRVILGELTNLHGRPKSRAKKPAAKPVAPLAAPEAAGVGGGYDPQLCEAYSSEIYDYLHSLEKVEKRRPLPDYIGAVQTDITANMRAVLVDWLVDVSEEYKLVPDTLFLTVSYIDRFLSVNSLLRQRLQLLGVTCMLVAAKYEEISPPHVEDLCYITDNTYTRKEMLEMEESVLNLLKFELGDATIKTFLRRFIRFAPGDHKPPTLQFECLCNFLAELCLMDYTCVKFLPSQVAASVVFVAKFTLNPDSHPWNLPLQFYSSYKPSDLKACVLAIHDLQHDRRWGPMEAAKTKYKQNRAALIIGRPTSLYAGGYHSVSLAGLLPFPSVLQNLALQFYIPYKPYLIYSITGDGDVWRLQKPNTRSTGEQYKFVSNLLSSLEIPSIYFEDSKVYSPQRALQLALTFAKRKK